MLTPDPSHIETQLTAAFGKPTQWNPETSVPSKCLLWTNNLPIELLLIYQQPAISDAQLRQIHRQRKAKRPVSVIIIAPPNTRQQHDDRARIAGPSSEPVVRTISLNRIISLIESIQSKSTREASSFIERELQRLEASVIPGIRVKDLLTPHYIRTRLLQRPADKKLLTSAIEALGTISPSTNWRNLFNRLEYHIQPIDKSGYILRHNNNPIAVLHPMRSPEQFGRIDKNGTLPEGSLIKDCHTYNTQWGILASDLRFRIFQAKPKIGSATARFIEIDARELQPQDRIYLGILAPNAMKQQGWMTKWENDARDWGEQLRKGLEERIRNIAMPQLAKGIGQHLEQTQQKDISQRQNLRQIEEAVLTIVFRFMFLLHVEARGYLPIQSHAYRPHSARQLAEECRAKQWELTKGSTRRWDQMQKLFKMIRNGDNSIGVPAYNGSLFAPDAFPGAEIIEKTQITDQYIVPAIHAMAFKDDTQHADGLDYAGLQIGHLGAIYESLLSLKLSRAKEPLAYDTKRDLYRPQRSGEKTTITRSELFYQTEKGGQKSGGVYYTRHEFVEHLLNNSLKPALENHLLKVRKTAQTDPSKAAQQLFNFSVLDPAMGSGHFLTVALDIIADRIDTFISEINGLPGIEAQLNQLRKPDDQPETTASHNNPLAPLPQIEDVDLLRRLVLKKCIYGVDLSPLAVEIANVTLWLASFVPGLALSYLGSNLKHGDSLIGVADPSIVGNIDPKAPTFAGSAVKQELDSAVQLQQQLAEISDLNPEEVKQSQHLNTELRDATAGLRRVFNLWAAEPLGAKGARGILANVANVLTGRYQDGSDIAQALDRAEQTADQYRFFHWPIEFPHIFHRQTPGFDVVCGNPPWNEITVEELAFYALREPGLRGLPNLADRRKRIRELDAEYPDWRGEFDSEQSRLKCIRGFFSIDGGYKLQGVGDKDLYRLFCERYTHLLRENARLGVVLPRSAFATEGGNNFRKWLFEQNTVDRIDIIRNTKRWAFNITPQYRIALLTASRKINSIDSSIYVTGPSESEREFVEVVSQGGVEIPRISLLPKYMVPVLTTQIHVDLLYKIRQGILFEFLSFAKLQNSEISILTKSKSKFQIVNSAAASRPVPYAELHETQQRSLFLLPEGQGDTPVWKGRTFGQYNPHGREPAGLCRWKDTLEFIHSKRSRSRIFKGMFNNKTLSNPSTHPVNFARIAFHDVTSSRASRTVIACLVPPMIPLTNKAPYLVFTESWNKLYESSVLGVMNSLTFDWQARRYVELNINYFILNMLCFPPPENTPWERIGKLAARLSCVDERFAQFASQAGVEYGPQTNAERDDQRAEIDALVAHAYRLNADELRFIFTDFTEKAVTPHYRQLVIDKFNQLQ